MGPLFRRPQDPEDGQSPYDSDELSFISNNPEKDSWYILVLNLISEVAKLSHFLNAVTTKNLFRQCFHHDALPL